MAELTLRERRILATAAAGLMVAVVLAALAGWQWRLADEQKTIANTQRARAEAALSAAAKTADTLVFDLAQDLRNRTGMPLNLVRLILERVQNLQRQLAQAGERTPELISLEAAALDELAALYLDQGDPAAALAISERSRDILQGLADALPNYRWLKRDTAIAWNKIAQALFYYDPNALIHGVFMANLEDGRVKMPRAITGFIEAEDVMEAVSGGVKNNALDPTGKFLYAANQGSNSVVPFAIHSDGTLTPTASPITANQPSFVGFAVVE